MCGCNKKNTPSRGPVIRPNRNIGPVQGGIASGPTPAALRALGLQTNTSTKINLQLDSDKRRIAKIKRDLARTKLGK